MNVQKAIFCGSKAMQPGQKLNPFGVKEMTAVRGNTLCNRKTIHVTAQVKYPEAKSIPLPSNIQAILSVEVGQFSPQRSRDISAPVVFSRSHDTFERHQPALSKAFDQFMESYDCNGVVSLSSSMQSNVPVPFRSHGNVMHLNMPGGQWEQGAKLVSEMQRSHYLHVTATRNPGTHMFHTLSNSRCHGSPPVAAAPGAGFASEAGEPPSRGDRLKRAVAEYGTTVVVFHVGISLVSLGAFYTLVSSGLDMERFVSYIPWIDASLSAATKNAGTFVTAYAIHKIFAPVRISITLTSVPFIVRHLRSIGFLKRRT